MSVRPSSVVIGVMAAVIAALAWALVYFARDELRLAAGRAEDEIPVRSSLADREGFQAVEVSPESQAASGIAVAPLQAARSRPVADVYGVVANVQPLIELRARYLAGMAEAQGLRAALASSRAEYERARKLYDDDRNISERALQAAEARWTMDQARLEAAGQSLAGLREVLRAAWGPVIAKWATEGRGTEFDALASQRQVVAQVVLPQELGASPEKAALAIGPLSARPARRAARFLSAAPQADGSAGGATYLYLADGSGLRAGMRVTGQLDLDGRASEGVAVPESAVVWHGGRAWAYVKEGESTFVRKPVATVREVPGGWFNAEGFDEGEQVVVSGAQLLLSEELKLQIRNENED